MKRFALFILSVVAACALSQQVQAQNAYTYTSVSYDENSDTVTAYSSTEPSYSTTYYYSSRVSLTVTDSDGNWVGFDSNFSTSNTARASVIKPGTGADRYDAIGTHELLVNYSGYYYTYYYGYNPPNYCCSSPGSYYRDYFNFGYFTNQNIDVPGYFDFFGPGPDTPTNNQNKRLGITRGSASAPGLRINSISPERGLVGSTVSVTISGTGFRSGATVQPGNGITVSDINVASDRRSITAKFNTASDAAGGNRAVTVKVGTRTSNSKNFFVQIPTKLVLQTTQPLQTPVYQDVKDLAGTVVATGLCGVYRNYGFILVDQGGQRITQPFTIDEDFASYSGPFSSPTATPGNIAADSLVPDLQVLAFRNRCLGLNENESFLIGYTVTVGAKAFSLTTINSVVRGDFAGVKKVEMTNVVP